MALLLLTARLQKKKEKKVNKQSLGINRKSAGRVCSSGGVAPLDGGQVHPLFHLLEMYWTKVWSLVVVACFSSWLNIGAISVAGRNGRDFNLGT
jgi:hypothetical protein